MKSFKCIYISFQSIHGSSLVHVQRPAIDVVIDASMQGGHDAGTDEVSI